jgi:hypothetical protein
MEFFNLVLHREAGVKDGQNLTPKSFREAFRIRAEEDWEDLNEEFQAFVKEDLMKRNPAQWDYSPPTRKKD